MLGQLHERERELDVIVAALDEVAARRGRVVVVEGPAGIGKTSLLDVGSEAARSRGLAVASARGSDLEVAYAWGVVQQLFEPRLRGMSAGSRDRVLAGAAALAGPIVLPGGSSPSAGADASFGVLHGLYWLVAGLAEQRPQLLVVDDLHWADEASSRFLEFLANRLDDLPVLLLAARRPAMAAARLAKTIELAPLSLEAAAGLLAERDGGSVSPPFPRPARTSSRAIGRRNCGSCATRGSASGPAPRAPTGTRTRSS
jgi:AAA ATPase-like protein